MSQHQIDSAAIEASRFTGGSGTAALALSEHGATAVVRMRGDIDAALTRSLRDALSWAVDHHPVVLVDLSAAGSIDGSGLGALARAHRRAMALGSVLCLVAPSRSVLVAVYSARLGEVPTVFEDLAGALAGVGAGGQRRLAPAPS